MNGPFLRKYGVSATIPFELFEIDGVDFRVDAVYAAGDVVITKDEGAEANTTNGFTDEGTGYSIVLTANEMQAARIVLYVVDQTAAKVWLDRKIVIETYGHASAEHEFDLDTASVAQTADHTAAIAAITAYIDTEITTIISNLAVLDGVADGIQADLSNTTDGLGALKALADAIKVKTDKLTFTNANEVDANVQSINDVEIVGDGDGTPFNV